MQLLPTESLTHIACSYRDPDSIVEFSDLLYNNTDFVMALLNALSHDGILVSQVGECEETSEPPVTAGVIDHSEDFLKTLKRLHFESVKEYNEAHGGFKEVWSFLIAFSDASLKSNFYANEAEFELKLKKRTLPTRSGKSPFRYFDGPTMMTYQFPCRLTEEQYCLAVPSPPLCDQGHGFNPELPNAPLSKFTMKKSASTSTSTNSGLFFSDAVPRGTYIAIEEGVHDILIMPSTHKSIQAMVAHGPQDAWRLLDAYEFCYGFATTFYGGTAFLVDGEVMSFANQGCNWTDKSFAPHWTPGSNRAPNRPSRRHVESSVYSPFIDRSHMLYINSFATTNEDIEAGTELIDKHLAYMHHENWTSTVVRTS